MHPRSKVWHLIDYIIIRKRDVRDMHSVRVMIGAECWTDHRLVRGSFLLKIRRKVKHAASSPPKRIDVSKLKCNEIAASFRTKISELEPLDPHNIWFDFKKKVYFTSSTLLGFVKRKHHDWFDENDEEMKVLLEDKKRMLNKTLISTGSEVEFAHSTLALKELKSDIQKRLRVMKNVWWESKAHEL